MRTTKELIIQTASEIADADGFSGVSLKAVAAALQIRTPSLYNHIDGLDRLLHEVAHSGMTEMNYQMTQAVIGVSGDEAIHAVAASYLKFLIAHPGVYETIQWASWHADDKTQQLLCEYRSLLEKLIRTCKLGDIDLCSVVRLITGFLHGYATQQLGSALDDPESAITDISSALDIILLGIHQKYQ